MECCVGVSIETVLQVVKFYTVVNWEKNLKNWRFGLKNFVGVEIVKLTYLAR